MKMNYRNWLLSWGWGVYVFTSKGGGWGLDKGEWDMVTVREGRRVERDFWRHLKRELRPR